MTNILEAICNIVQHQDFNIKNLYSGKNKMNNMGEALEAYVKDAFANTLGVKDEQLRMKTFSQVFSWLGTQNNPPDIMIKGGDAIEVKKIENAKNDIALNSSYPKADIHSSNPMITNECKTCEDWTTKELIYCIGHTSNEKLNSLWMFYGNIYAAKQETYERIKSTISEGIKTIPDVEFSVTKELGRVNYVDPLGITNLRIRGMWQIQNPKKVFNYLHKDTRQDFELVCIIPVKQYDNFPIDSKNRLEAISNNGFTIKNVCVKDPNNPARLIDCKLIKLLV